jgi:hypothetical protein
VLVNIVCPHCDAQSKYPLGTEGDHNIACTLCHEAFQVTLGTARAKRSRGQKSTNSRRYSIRYTTAGTENFVEFDSNCYDDAELRSKDLFVLSSIAGQIRVLQNLTVGTYWQVNTPAQGCLTIILVAIVFITFAPVAALLV